MGSRRFSLYDIEQFIREAGAERITEDAVKGLEKEIEKLAEQLANKAMVYASHAGRKKLIRTADIMLTEKHDIFAGDHEHATSQSRPANFSRNASITKNSSKSDI